MSNGVTFSSFSDNRNSQFQTVGFFMFLNDLMWIYNCIQFYVMAGCMKNSPYLSYLFCFFIICSTWLDPSFLFYGLYFMELFETEIIYISWRSINLTINVQILFMRSRVNGIRRKRYTVGNTQTKCISFILVLRHLSVFRHLLLVMKLVMNMCFGYKFS